MKAKTILRTFLTLAAIAVLFIPGAIFAEESTDGIWVGGVHVTKSGDVTGDGISGKVTYDEDTDVLTLENAVITGVSTEGSGDPANIHFEGDPLTIQLKGNNQVGDGRTTQIGIDACDALTMTGDGKLYINAINYGLYAEEALRFESASVSLSSKTNSGIHAVKTIKVDDSAIEVATTGLQAISARKSIMICNSVVKASAVDTQSIEAFKSDISIIDSYVVAESKVDNGKTQMQGILADQGKIRISYSTVIASGGKYPAIQAKKPISIIDSEFLQPVNGRMDKVDGVYTIVDGTGKAASEVALNPVKDPATMAAIGKTVTLKSGAKKLKKAKKITAKKAYTILKPSGTVTFKKVKANKSSGKFKVNKKTGKITVKKGTKNGTYKLTVKVIDSGSATNYGIEENVVVTIKVKK